MGKGGVRVFLKREYTRMNLVVQLAIFLLGYRLTYVFLSCTGLICFFTLSVFKCPEAAQPLALPAAPLVVLPAVPLVVPLVVLPTANVPVVQLHRHVAVVCVINRNVVVGLCRHLQHLQHLPTRANFPQWRRVPRVNNVDNSVQI